MDKIVLPEINVYACHGVEDFERENPQPFRISVQLTADLSKAAASDDVGDTIHYGELYADIRSLAQHESYALLETLAENIAALCLESPLAQSVIVTVAKLQAQYGGQVFPAIVEIERRRA